MLTPFMHLLRLGKRHLISGSFLTVFALPVFADAPQNFQQAKRVATRLFDNHRQTLYCGCRYNQQRQIDLASCHMQAAESIKRAHRVEWEHMSPMENVGRQFRCWREALCERQGKAYKGRKCCAKIDKQFRRAEAELYNLWPAEGLVNQARSNYRYGEVSEKRGFYGCVMQIDKKERKAEPDDRVKGLVARANLFMALHYGLKLSSSQRQLLEAWHKQFPPDDWEKEWALKIAAIEGYENPYIRQQG